MHPSLSSAHEGILILDYGSQYTLLIARRLRELQVYCEVISCEDSIQDSAFTVRGIILSGGPDSVSSTSSRSLPDWVMDLHIPVLGICYGMQLLVRYFHGSVRCGSKREYGKSLLQLPMQPEVYQNTAAGILWKDILPESTVWMSHGDDVETLPRHQNITFHIMAKTQRSIAAIASSDGRYFGLQYHPEVEHTQGGTDMLKRFAYDVCKIQSQWDSGNMLSYLIEHILQQVEKHERVCVACSGGVDSTVCLVLMSQALGADRVQGVFVDTGLLRLNEAQNVQSMLEKLGISITILHKQQHFYERLQGVSDPEKKRQIIGHAFIDCFAEFAQNHKQDYHILAQGTLYSDVIESGHGGYNPQVIKTHHNVGALPDVMPFKLIEPLRFLFKDEVRALGAELKIPHHILWQHPFPGPGLGVRIAGSIDMEKISLLQQADAIYLKALRSANLYDRVWQAFAVLLPVKSVGVMGDSRTHQWVVSLRAVTASDAMTAEVADLPLSFLTEVAESIVSQVSGINRVLFDITTKPPATIEWE